MLKGVEMKKILVILFIILLMATVIACNDNESKAENDQMNQELNASEDQVISQPEETLETDKVVEWQSEDLRVVKSFDGNDIDGIHIKDNGVVLYDHKALLKRETFIPEGWRMPIESEWLMLMESYGGKSICFDSLITPELFNCTLEGMYDFSGQFQWEGTSFVYAFLSDDLSQIVYYYYNIEAQEVMKGNFHPDDGVSIRLVKDK